MARPQCKGCKAVIRWVQTRAGRSMPVDPDRLTEWLVEDAQAMPGSRPRMLTLITPEGETVTGAQGSVLTPGAREVVGYIPHWATCPQAAAFKR